MKIKRDIFAHKKSEIGKAKQPIEKLKSGGSLNRNSDDLKKLALVDLFIKKYPIDKIHYEWDNYASQDKEYSNSLDKLESKGIELEKVDYDGEGYFNFWDKDLAFKTGGNHLIKQIRYNIYEYPFPPVPLPDWAKNQFKAGGRVSPSNSATLYETGFIAKSENDGNFWMVKEDKNGRKSWKKSDPPKPKPQRNQLTASDIKPGRRFIDEKKMIWIVDNIYLDNKFGKLVESSYTGGEKGNFRDSIKEFITFLNERKATIYDEEPLPDKLKLLPPSSILELPSTLIDDAYFLIGLQKDRINKKPSGWDINLFKSSFTNKVKRLKKGGFQTEVNDLLNWFEAVEKDQLSKPVFTKKNAIWKLRDFVPDEAPNNDLSTKLDEEINDLNIVYNWTDIQPTREDIRETVNLLEDLKLTNEKESFNIYDSMNRYFKLSATPLSIINDEAPKVSKDLIKTNKFKNWFGDWEDPEALSSKVESLGKPLIVYHGTKISQPFSRFDMNKFPVMYFADNYDYAKWFAKLGKGIVYPTFLNIKYLFDLSPYALKPFTWTELVKYAKEQGVSLPTDPGRKKIKPTTELTAWQWLRNDTPKNVLTNAVKRAGYTGMKHVENNPQDLDENKNQRLTDAYMIFNPNQAKIIVNGNDFENISNVMYMSKGGSIKERLKRLKQKTK